MIDAPIDVSQQVEVRANPISSDRLSALEAEVAELRAELRDMRVMLEDLTT